MRNLRWRGLIIQSELILSDYSEALTFRFNTIINKPVEGFVGDFSFEMRVFAGNRWSSSDLLVS